MSRRRWWWFGLAGLLAALVYAPASVAERILFTNTSETGEVWVMGDDGSGLLPVTHGTPTGFSPAWSPDGSRIAFVGLSSDPSLLWSMAPDGSRRRSLGVRCGTPFLPAGCDPDWAPGGRILAFTTGRHIYVVPRDGAPRRQVTHGRHDVDPAWSPTGEWIVFRGPPGLTLIRPAGTDRRFIGPGDEPDWSPTGRRIVFADWAPGEQRDLFSMRMDGSDRRRLTRTARDESTPAWSPGGGKIAFSRDEDLWVMNPDGSGARRLVRNAVNPSWAPSGRRLAFSRFHEGDERAGYSLYTIRLDGSGLRRLLTPRSDGAVAASPDGARIAYTSDRLFSRSGIYVADADGTDETFVHSGFGPDFSPDGSRLVFQGSDEIPYVVEADGGTPAALPLPGQGIEGTWGWHWHPDGHVSFVGRTDDLCADVYTMQLDGTELTRVTPAGCFPTVLEFDWTPDGTTLVFAAAGCVSCPAGLYRQSVPGGTPTALTDAGTFDDDLPAISPDGTRVAFARSTAFLERPTLWVIDVDGTDETQLTFGEAESGPDWLPDSR